MFSWLDLLALDRRVGGFAWPEVLPEELYQARLEKQASATGLRGAESASVLVPTRWHHAFMALSI